MQKRICVALILFAAGSAWAQIADPNASTAITVEDRMLVPAPVSGDNYSVALASEEQSNYLHYGITVGAAYSDNVLGGTAGHAVSDMSYSAWPTIGLDETTSRLHWGLTYAPGFTVYQRTSERNEADQNALLSFQYRLSPHVTFNARDTFQKSSSVFNQPDLASSAGVSGGTQVPNFSVIAPIANRLSNIGNLGITYQFGANDMIGAGGGFTNLHYSDTSQVSGLSDDSSQTATAFYSHRIAKRHYVGAAYQYQRLLSYPEGLENNTQTNSALLFYTVYPATRFSLSVFGGPQYSETTEPELTTSLTGESFCKWTPAAGASLSWEGRRNSAVFSYAHVISGGSGLIGAVRLDQASLSLRSQITRFLTGSIAGFYANNNMLSPSLQFDNGHTFSGTVALQRTLTEHITGQIGYSRLHQTYNLPIFATTPDTNREFISITYDFARPLGR